jgi:hypothetical protein
LTFKSRYRPPLITDLSLSLSLSVSVPSSAHNSHLSKPDTGGGCAAGVGRGGGQGGGRGGGGGGGTGEGAGGGGGERRGGKGRGLRTVTLRRAAGDEMAWCGLLLDTRSLQVRRDYSRYEGASLRDAVTIGFDSSPGVRLRDRTIGAIKAKLLPILLDSGVNSAHRLRYNVYQAVVFGALIMGAHASGLANMYR